MIRMENVSKSYPLAGFRRHYVFRKLSLELPNRVNVGIVGRNGAGKSTLLRLLGHIDAPDSGQVRIQGTISPPLGLSSGFATHLSGLDNAKFVCRIFGDDSATARERIGWMRDFTELGEFFEYPVNTYSTGMRARLAFAISMAYEFDYYLIDELTAVGDQKFRQKAVQVFDRKRGKASMIMVSHNLAQLRQDCQAGLYLKGGEAIFYDRIQDAIDAYQKDQAQP